MLNKILKLTVISAVLMTSGFTQQQATISGYVTNNDTFEIGNGVTVNMADGATIHNYADITGSGEIDGGGKAKIINYNHILTATEDDTTCFRPTGGGSVASSINKTDVTVTDQKADISVSFDDSNKAGNTILLTTDNCDTTDTDKILTMTNTSGNPITVDADISNNSDGTSFSHSIDVDGDFIFNGDQSRFNQDGTTWNVNGGISNIATDKAFPQTEVNVNNGSELNINAPGIVTAYKDVTVTGSQLNIGKTSTLKLGKGVTLWFKAIAPSEGGGAGAYTYTIVKDGTDLSTVDWDNTPTASTWLILERAAEANSPVFALRTDKGASRIGIMETNAALVYDEDQHPELLDVTIGNNALIKLDGTTYKGRDGGDTDAVLSEIDTLLKTGSWGTFGEYKSNSITAQGLTVSGTTLGKYSGSATNIVIPYGVTEIAVDSMEEDWGVGAFSDKTSLESIIIPDSVTVIKKYTFSGCGNLRSITIPDSVETIGDGSFYECTKLINNPANLILPSKFDNERDRARLFKSPWD